MYVIIAITVWLWQILKLPQSNSNVKHSMSILAQIKKQTKQQQQKNSHSPHPLKAKEEKQEKHPTTKNHSTEEISKHICIKNLACYSQSGVGYLHSLGIQSWYSVFCIEEPITQVSCSLYRFANWHSFVISY